VNRVEGKLGVCRVGAGLEISHAGLHFGEEPPLSGTRGSGTIFFAGCNLRCVFCQNYQISQEFQRGGTRTVTADELAGEMLRLQEAGAHNINLVSPSHVIFQVAEALETARGQGLAIPVVFNSNGYDSVAALREVRGLVDIYLPDIKYMDNRLGKRLSAVDDYAENIGGVIEEMLGQVGHLRVDGAGIAARGLLVRHLVLPGQVENSRRCLRALAELSRETFVSIMSQYSPQYQAGRFSDINRTLAKDEYDEVVDFALSLGLENAFIQELASQGHYLPDFAKASPFEGGSDRSHVSR
jgi:putative pyruvate formate lyase activating enzyme